MDNMRESFIPCRLQEHNKGFSIQTSYNLAGQETEWRFEQKEYWSTQKAECICYYSKSRIKLNIQSKVWDSMFWSNIFIGKKKKKSTTLQCKGTMMPTKTMAYCTWPYQ